MVLPSICAHRSPVFDSIFSHVAITGFATIFGSCVYGFNHPAIFSIVLPHSAIFHSVLTSQTFAVLPINPAPHSTTLKTSHITHIGSSIDVRLKSSRVPYLFTIISFIALKAASCSLVSICHILSGISFSSTGRTAHCASHSAIVANQVDVSFG